MGSGSSLEAVAGKEARARDRDIQQQLSEEALAAAAVTKLLLLGTSDSGKSTFVKQMKIIHMTGFTAEDYRQYKLIVYTNVIQSICAIVRAMDALGIAHENAEREADAAIVIEEENHSYGGMDERLSNAIKNLWLSPPVQAAFKRSNEYQLHDSAKYFLDKIDAVSLASFMLSEQDVLRCRVTTTGIVEIRFSFKNKNFRLFDVGGQRSERKKWIHCFDNVNALIFCVALSEYDQVLVEDGKTNRMRESLRLFGEICNTRYFIQTAIILFLNKKDLFQEKILHTSIKMCFTEYTGQDTLFRFYAAREKGVYTHRTCATDTKNVQFVFNAATDIILGKNLEKGGLF